jgi:serine/threonine protein kinase
MLQERDYGYAVDWWTLGITMYGMLCGRTPFEGDNEDNIFDNIINDEILYPVWISFPAKSLLIQLLKKNPSKR